MARSKDGISVIICCYDSALRLPETLKHLSLQRFLSDIRWEIILVDNRSNDDTAKIARDEWSKYTCAADFRIIHESNPGLSHARHRGINASAFEYLIFCDDDNWLADDYLINAYTILNSDKNIAALGGFGEAVSDIVIPEWFYDVQNAYAVGKQYTYQGDVSCEKHLWGAGLALRKSIYFKAFTNFPSLTTGRNGNILSAGEDYELCIRFVLMKYRLHYSEKLFYRHYIPAARLSLSYKERLFAGFRLTDDIFNCYYTVYNVAKMRYKQKLKILLRSVNNLMSLQTTKEQRLIARQNIFLIVGLYSNSFDNDTIRINNLRPSIIENLTARYFKGKF